MITLTHVPPQSNEERSDECDWSRLRWSLRSAGAPPSEPR
jgi:hypothetical protein